MFLISKGTRPFLGSDFSRSVESRHSQRLAETKGSTWLGWFGVCGRQSLQWEMNELSFLVGWGAVEQPPSSPPDWRSAAEMPLAMRATPSSLSTQSTPFVEPVQPGCGGILGRWRHGGDDPGVFGAVLGIIRHLRWPSPDFWGHVGCWAKALVFFAIPLLMPEGHGGSRNQDGTKPHWDHENWDVSYWEGISLREDEEWITGWVLEGLTT